MTVNVIKIDNKADFETHLDIRKRVFQDELGYPSRDENDKYDKARLCHWFLASVDGIPAGAARWRENKAGYKLERICVLPEYRGKGVAKALMAALLHDVPKNLKINLGAPFDIVPFFEKQGFKARGEAYWDFGLRLRFMKYVGGGPASE